MTQHTDDGTRASTAWTPDPWEDLVDAPPRRPDRGPDPRRAGRLDRSARSSRRAALASAVVLLALFAGDLAVALLLPVRTSTCTDRLCGPGLGLGAGAVGVALVALVVWMVGDVRRDRGKGAGLCWAAAAVAAVPWLFVTLVVTLPLRWW